MSTQQSQSIEHYFSDFRKNTLGYHHQVRTFYGVFPMVYTDWIAEGRMYGPIEEKMTSLSPFIANPHSYNNYTGTSITSIYKEARQIIKDHVNASKDDILVTVGHGMTGAIERLIHILEKRFNWNKESENRPVVFITHMEHHSNHTVWEQAGVDLVILPPNEKGLPCPKNLKTILKKYADRKVKIGSFSGCSNVSGIISPYHQLAEVMHEAKGLCFVDFAASAPYVEMNMHPSNPKQKLDAIFFAPHKFLGGPGTCGVLVFDKSLHPGEPCISGGGNVKWTQPTGGYGVAADLETMEDAGTPAYLQTIKTALSIQLKQQMGVKNIQSREHELLHKAIATLKPNNDIELIDCEHELEKIGVISFNIKGMHYNLVVRLLNDRFGIQTRGGWSCASTYAHYLYELSNDDSNQLISNIRSGNMTGKPGWVRLSLHPTMTTEELDYCLNAIKTIIEHRDEWSAIYQYNTSDNEYYPVENQGEFKMTGFFN